MKTFTSLALLFAAAGLASADAPKKPSVGSYAHLWNNSPFTSKPPPPEKGPESSAVDEWALRGVSEVEGGYMVRLQHKKNAGETQIIRPSGTMKYFADRMEEVVAGASGAFKVDSVDFGKDKWMETVVHLSSGGRSGIVKFDDKALLPKAGAAAPRNGQPNPNGQPNANGQIQPVQPAQPGQPAVRPPRPRGNGAPANAGGR